MSDIWTMGELLVEIMRPRPGMGLREHGEFLGPFPSGAPGIFIDTAARLGHRAAIVSGVGDDEFGRCILARLSRDGVDTDLVQVFPGRSTGVAFVSYDQDGSRRFIFHWDGTPAVMADVPSRTAVGSPRVLHVMGCSLMANAGFRERVFETVSLFAGLGAQITFDPNIRFELLRDGTIDTVIGPIMDVCGTLMPGESELCRIAETGDTAEAARRLFDRYPLREIVVKRGSRGCTVYTRDQTIDVPGFRVDEVDPTGAGDCFDAGYVCARLSGKSAEQAALEACAAGALNAEAFGPMEGDISPDTVAALIARYGRRS